MGKKLFGGFSLKDYQKAYAQRYREQENIGDKICADNIILHILDRALADVEETLIKSPVLAYASEGKKITQQLEKIYDQWENKRLVHMLAQQK